MKGRVIHIAIPPSVIALAAIAPSPEEPDEPESEPAPVVAPRAGSWPLSIVGFGLAGAGAIVGTVTGIAALNRISTLETHCPNRTCPASLVNTRDTGQTLATISTVAFITSAAGIALGLLMLPDGPITVGAHRTVRVGIGVGSIGATGTF